MEGLEAQELYIFRVAGANRLGQGNFVTTEDTLLSHHIGVPSPPSQPEIVSWSDEGVIISTIVHKFGSSLDFMLIPVKFLNETVVSSGVGTALPGNYTLGDEVQLHMRNVSYRGDWRFAVIASNRLGSSLTSQLSLRGRRQSSY